MSSEYTIDGLAVASGVPSRTIRLYQTKGVLPGPERRGRTAFYGPEHIERLRLIGELQDRGLQLSAIRDLLSHGGDVGEWLGLGEQLARPWSEDRPRVYDPDELAALIEGRPPGTLAALLRTGVLARQGDRYRAESPGLLRAALALDDAGVDYDTSAGAAAIMRKRLGQVADELVKFLVERTGDGFGRDATPDSIAAAFEGVRTTGGDAVRLIFTAEVEHALAEHVASGGIVRRARRQRQQ